MPTDYEIRDRVAAYLLAETSLDEFQEWVIPLAWAAGEGDADIAETSARELLGDLELCLAEYTNGDRDEIDLREALSAALKTHRIDTSSQRTGSSALQVSTAFAFKPFAVADTPV